MYLQLWTTFTALVIKNFQRFDSTDGESTSRQHRSTQIFKIKLTKTLLKASLLRQRLKVTKHFFVRQPKISYRENTVTK